MPIYQMEAEHRNALRKNRIFLQKNIVLKKDGDLVNHLFAEKILTEDMKEEIEAEKLTRDKIGKLLDILPKRGPKAFQEFIFGLMLSEQPFIAESLDSDGEFIHMWESQQNQQTAKKPKSTVLTKSNVLPKVSIPRYPASAMISPAVPKPSDSRNESPLLMLTVNPVDLEDPAVDKLILNTKDVYSMSRKPRGLAVIINNSHFVNSPARDGAAVDSLNLCEHFKQLGFETVLYDDITAKVMKDIFRNLSRDERHWNADCFVAFVLSHGSQGHVYGMDGHSISIEADIVTQFDGDHCKALTNKPKMFFIQACQGDSVTEGTSEVGDSVDASPDPYPEDRWKKQGEGEEEVVVEALRNLQIQDDDRLQLLSRSHEKSDIVIAYSTVPGYRSWRRTDLGSWFVRAIIEVFSAEACREDLLSLLVKVRSRVSEEKTNHEDRSFVQLTRTDETTKKKIYFFPGYYASSQGDSV